MAADKKVEKIESVCAYCGVGCDITADISENRIIRIYAGKDGAVSQGKLCIKGKYGYEFIDAKNRIREPRIRKDFLKRNPVLEKKYHDRLSSFDRNYLTCDLDTALEIAAFKLDEIRKKRGGDSFCAIGGARTSCESAYTFQKFCRETMGSPHIDNCARICHSPSLSVCFNPI
jgi:formate dehydrogenase major subunit